MEALGVVINAVVMAGVGLALWWAFRGRFDALEKRMERLEQRMDRLEDRLEASVDSLRSDLTAVALAVGARPGARGR